MQTIRLRWRIGEIVRWIVVVSALVSTVGAARSRVQAQDAGLIYAQRTEVLFPVVIRFVVGVAAEPDAIASVSLTMSQETGLDETFTFVPDEHIFADHGTSVELVFDWLLSDSASVPKPFVALDYSWVVETTDGLSSEAEGQFDFVDGSVGAWETANDGPVVLHWHNTQLAGHGLQTDVMHAYDLLTEHLERPVEVEVAVYDPDVPLCQQIREDDGSTTLNVISSLDGQNYPCSEQQYAALYEASGITFLKRAHLGYSDLQDDLITVVVRTAYADLWRGKTVPAWFEAGLAGMYHLLPNHYALEVTRAADRTESLFSLDELTFYPASDLDVMQAALWESESYLLVLYLADQFGAEAPFELAQQVIAEPGGFDATFAAFTGRDLRVYWSEWERWLFGNGAVDATRWTPYLLTTPTPTPTPTPTVIVPTATWTLVPTYTPTGVFGPSGATDQGASIANTPTPPPAN